MVALLTDLDGLQRCYEHPWSDDAQLDAFRRQLTATLRARGLQHACPWRWKAETSTGEPLTHSGRATGLELRFSYYA